jgi:hypothetical protein
VPTDVDNRTSGSVNSAKASACGADAIDERGGKVDKHAT